MTSLPSDTPTIIALCWDDACYYSEDTQHRDLGQLVRLYEIGFLINETPEAVTLCSEWSEGATSSRLTLTVPKVNIVWEKRVEMGKVIGGRRR